MARTSSLAWPNMFNITQNQVATFEDNTSIVSRSRLLILTEPKELHYNPNFGVGLKRHLFKYNTENEKTRMQNRIREQLRLHEPYVDPDDTKFADGLLMSGENDPVALVQDANHLKMTIALATTYSDVAQLTMEEWEGVTSDD